MYFDLNSLLIAQVCETSAILINIALLDYHQTSEEISSKLYGNRYGTRNIFPSVRKCKETEEDQLSKAQKTEKFSHRDDTTMFS